MTDYKFEADRDITSFVDLPMGEMFVDEDEKPFIKTLNIEEYISAKFNAVQIADGALYHFYDNERVVRIKKAVFTV